MDRSPQTTNMIQRLHAVYSVALRTVVYILAFVAGLGILIMMGVTCVDVILRRFGHPLIGALDIVKAFIWMRK